MTKITKDHYPTIIKRYLDGESCDIIALTYRVKTLTISRIIRKTGYINKNKGQRRRIHHFNQNFFDIIDTEEKAYFLGFLYADGCNNTFPEYKIGISLQERDAYILEKFKNCLGYNTANIIHRNRSKENPNWQDQKYLYMHSKHMSEVLNNIGMIPSKSLTAEFPNLSIFHNDTLRHFIRGYFDGDGHIGIYDHIYHGNKKDTIVRQTRFQILGSKIFLEALKTIFNDSVGVKVKICNTQSKIWQLISSDRSSVIRIYDWIYSNSSIFLTRKRDKFLELKSLPPILEKYS